MSRSRRCRRRRKRCDSSGRSRALGFANLDYSPDGSMVAVDREAGQPGVFLIDPANGDVLTDIGSQYGTWGLAFDPGGAELAVAYGGSSGSPAIGRFEVPSGRAAGAFWGPAGSYEQLSYHPDGRWLGAVRLDDDRPEREIIVWAVDSPDVPISLGPGTAYGFLPGTTTVAIAGALTKAHFASSTSRPVSDPVDRDPDIEIEVGIAVDPNSHRLALVSGQAEQVVVLDLGGGEPVETLVVTGFAVGRVQPRRKLAGGRLAATTSSTCSPPRTSRTSSCRDRRATSPTWRSLPTAPGWRRSASRATSILGAGARRSPRLGQPPRLWRRAATSSSSEGASTAVATVDGPDASVTAERIDMATGERSKSSTGCTTNRTTWAR